MEALRHSLTAPALTSTFMMLGCAHAMMEMVKTRYAAKDDNGKPLLPHPYQPWVTVDKKYQEKVDKSYRAFRMFENVKEWTFLALPLMWTFAVFGSGLPYVTEPIMDGIIISSGVAFMAANHYYIEGYIRNGKDRLSGFKVRRKVVELWLVGAVVSTLWSGISKLGFVA